MIAANDSDVLQFGRDTYSYMWPRDGALTAAALDDAGYGDLSRRFFEFCARVIANAGYFLHKYNPDGSRGVSTFTAGAVFGGLTAAASFAELFGEAAKATRYRAAADAVRSGMARHLFVKDAGRFARLLTETGADRTVDASLYGVWAFGAFEPGDPRVRSTMVAVRERLWVPTAVGGCARYEGDAFQRATADAAIPGNPWIICTLWLAQYEIETATTAEDLERARPYLDWVVARARPSGVLPEQVDPYDGSPRSVAPLTWSHAELVRTARRLAERRAVLRPSADAAAPSQPNAGEAAWPRA